MTRMEAPNKKRNGGVTDDSTYSNNPGVRLKECPIDVLNKFIVLKLVPQRESNIHLPESALQGLNSAVVVGCGADVVNKEYLLGKHVVFAKFRYFEPFQFVDSDGKASSFLILQDTDIAGIFIDQTQSAQYSPLVRAPAQPPKIKPILKV